MESQEQTISWDYSKRFWYPYEDSCSHFSELFWFTSDNSTLLQSIDEMHKNIWKLRLLHFLKLYQCYWYTDSDFHDGQRIMIRPLTQMQ